MHVGLLHPTCKADIHKVPNPVHTHSTTQRDYEKDHFYLGASTCLRINSFDAILCKYVP